MKVFLILAVFLAGAAQEITINRVTVVYNPKEKRLARALADRAGQTVEYLEKEFGLSIEAPLSIFLASSLSEFNRLQPGDDNLPAWVAGTAYPELGVIVIKSTAVRPGLELERVLDHELSHIALGRIFARSKVPVWLNEGLTMHLADDWSLGRQIAMARALAAGRLIPLNRLITGFPFEQIDAETAYAQSYYFISFLKDRCGSVILGRLIQRLGLGVKAKYALKEATGLDVDELEEEFQQWLKIRFSLYWLLIGPGGAVWFLGALVLLVAYLRRRKAARRLLDRWEVEENETGAFTDRSGKTGGEVGPDNTL